MADHAVERRGAAVSAVCLYFGCYREPGHYLFASGWQSLGPRGDAVVRFLSNGESIHIDGSLAPLLSPSGRICWSAQGGTMQERERISCRSEEAPQGQFLRHELPNGYTAIQWWDRQQGDTRGGSNSTILLAGQHDTAAMLAALDQHFPRVRANLERGGVALVEVPRG